MKIAVIGAGISGLGCAYTLSQALSAQLAAGAHSITLLEQGRQLGGHANTVNAVVNGQSHAIDTGFLVYNERTYPQLIQLFSELKIPVAKSDMSFSVRNTGAGLEWSGNNLDTVFTQRRNLFRARFIGMLREILRFNKQATELARQGQDQQMRITVGEFLRTKGYSSAFIDWYFLPMIAAIWSCPVATMMGFPMATMIRFCHNHGLLQVNDRPQWFTVQGGSRVYVDTMAQLLQDRGVQIVSNAKVSGLTRGVAPNDLPGHASGWFIRTQDQNGHFAPDEQYFDYVILACHSDQALHLISHTNHGAKPALQAVKYQPNHAVLHTDRSVLPKHTKAWAAWNYESTGETAHNGERQVALHYLINKLQPLNLDTRTHPVIVSLNPTSPIDPSHILQEFEYDHPVFDHAAIQAQTLIHQFQGEDHIWFCGAWLGYGFHEDGLTSGINAAKLVLNAITNDARVQDAKTAPVKLAA